MISKRPTAMQNAKTKSTDIAHRFVGLQLGFCAYLHANMHVLRLRIFVYMVRHMQVPVIEQVILKFFRRKF